MKHNPIDIEHLYTAARELTVLLPRLQETIPEKNTTLESSIGSHQKHVAAPIPWNSPAAMLFLEIHGDVRSHENALTLRLFRKAKYRGGADTLTLEAIKRLPVLIAHARETLTEPGDTDAIEEIARTLHSWPRRVRAQLDEPRPDEQPWSKAPGNLSCPHCDRRLELRPGWTTNPEQADVVCRQCHDDQGEPLRWAPTTWLAVLQHQDAG